jgi:nitric oxide reductase subunit B
MPSALHLSSLPAKKDLLISKAWIQAIGIVGLCGFSLLGILAYHTYSDAPPIPSRVIGPGGQVVFTGKDVQAGQEIFLKNGLMEYGSILATAAISDRTIPPTISTAQLLSQPIRKTEVP